MVASTSSKDEDDQMTIRQSVVRHGKKAEDAVMKEVSQMYTKGVWRHVAAGEYGRKPDDILIPSKMFVKIKKDANGNFVKVKSRLVASGNLEPGGLVKDEYAAPTASVSIAFMLLQVAAVRGWRFRAVDVTAAFLHTQRQENDRGIFMWLPKDVTDMVLKRREEISELDDIDLDSLLTRGPRGGRLMVKLTRNLYGLKEAPRDWYLTVKKGLCEECVMEMCEHDMCLFRMKDGSHCYVVLYVDDMLVIYDREETMQRFEAGLRRRFPDITVSDEGKVNFLQMNIVRQPEGDISVDQHGYVEKMLMKRMVAGTAVVPGVLFPRNSTGNPPGDVTGEVASEEEGEDRELTEEEQELAYLKHLHGETLADTMALMYLAQRSRPDILHSVVMASCDLTKRTAQAAIRLNRVVQYLRRTGGRKLIFRTSADLQLTCAADASFDQHEGAKGHSGYAIWLDRSMVSAALLCKSKMQKVPAGSSMEAELICVHDATQCVVNMKHVVEFVLRVDHVNTVLYQDNKSNVVVCNNEIAQYKGQSKHMNRKYFVSVHLLRESRIDIVWLTNARMYVDLFTKLVVGEWFDMCSSRVMGQPTRREWILPRVGGGGIATRNYKVGVIIGMSKPEKSKRPPSPRGSVGGKRVCDGGDGDAVTDNSKNMDDQDEV